MVYGSSSRLCCAILVVVVALAGLSDSLEPERGDPTGSWVVQVRGGRKVAEQLAEKHGFRNLGQVSAVG